MKELQTDSGTRRCALMVTVDFIAEKELKTWPADECVHRCACSCVCVCEQAACWGVSQAHSALETLTVPLV